MTFLVAAAIAIQACGAPRAMPMKGDLGVEIAAAMKSGRASFDHSEWNDLLSRFARDGLVDYTGLARDSALLDEYLARVAAAEIASLSSGEAKAFFINAYNAITVRSILENPEVASIRDIDGVWTGKKHVVGGHELTLDDIEHRVLRPYFKDARIHFAINCASRSCAPLNPFAFTGAGLDTALDVATRVSLARPGFLAVDDSGIVATPYLDWFAEDFNREGGARSFLSRYAPPADAAIIASDSSLPIRFADYDWSLNASPRGETGAGE